MEKFTATLRELDARLAVLLVPLSVKYSDLLSTYPRSITINSHAGTNGSVSFSGFIMSNNAYSQCILHGRFRASTVEDMPEYKYTTGNIQDFMQNYKASDPLTVHNATSITVKSKTHQLTFRK